MKRNAWITNLILGALLVGNAAANCQSFFPKDLYIKAAYRQGYVLPEYSLYDYLVDDYVHSFAFSISKRVTDAGDWAQVYHYPEYGIALQYSTLGNKEIFGEEVSLYPFFTLHILEAGRFSLMNQTGLGLGLVNKKFDKENNPYNVAVGTALNLHFNLEFNIQYRFFHNLFLTTGLGIDHFSNGNLGEPNLGINYMTFNGGVRFLPGEKSEPSRHEPEKHIPSTQTAIILSVGEKHARSLQSRSYFISSLSFEIKRKLWRTFYPGIGADLFYDGASQEEIYAFGDEVYKGIYDFKSGLHIEEELVYNKFSLALQEGIYLGLTEKAFHNKSYNRFIVRQQFGDHFFVQLAMKSHVVVLDFLEFGVGYHGKS